jgi:hypothetical protein
LRTSCPTGPRRAVDATNPPEGPEVPITAPQPPATSARTPRCQGPTLFPRVSFHPRAQSHSTHAAGSAAELGTKARRPGVFVVTARGIASHLFPSPPQASQKGPQPSSTGPEAPPSLNLGRSPALIQVRHKRARKARSPHQPGRSPALTQHGPKPRHNPSRQASHEGPRKPGRRPRPDPTPPEASPEGLRRQPPANPNPSPNPTQPWGRSPRAGRAVPRPRPPQPQHAPSSPMRRPCLVCATPTRGRSPPRARRAPPNASLHLRKRPRTRGRPPAEPTT